MTNDALKPCPSCKSITVNVISSEADLVQCDLCGMNGPQKFNRAEAVAAWNALPRARPQADAPTPVSPAPAEKEAARIEARDEVIEAARKTVTAFDTRTRLPDEITRLEEAVRNWDRLTAPGAGGK